MADARPRPMVFIVYAHNPEEYTQLKLPDPSEVEDESRKAKLLQQWKDHEEKVSRNIRGQEELVTRFAGFLRGIGVAADYDRLVQDTGCSNLIKWMQSKIEESKFVILIISPSFLPFLEGVPFRPPFEKEAIFSSDYLYNKIHNPGKTLFLPVFLNRRKDLSLLPKVLEASSAYEILEPFSLENSEELMSCYCRLTGQNRYVPPPPGPVVPIVSQRRLFGSSQTYLVPRQPYLQPPVALNHHAQGVSHAQQPVYSVPAVEYTPLLNQKVGELYNALSKLKTAVPLRTCAKLSEDIQFSICWKEIGTKLGLTPVQLEQCRKADTDCSYCCREMLGYAKKANSSIADLAYSVYCTGHFDLLLVIDSCIPHA